jgi:hypothetical protein
MRMKWGHVACMGEKEVKVHAYKIVVGEPNGGNPHIGPTHRWKDNIKMGLKMEGAAWTHLTIDRDQCTALGNTVMNVRLP